MNKPYKAVAAFVLTFLGTLIASVQGRKDFSELTVLEWLIVVGSALVTTGVVYGVNNDPAAYRRNRGLRGESTIALIVGVLVVLILLVLLLRLV